LQISAVVSCCAARQGLLTLKRNSIEMALSVADIGCSQLLCRVPPDRVGRSGGHCRLQRSIPSRQRRAEQRVGCGLVTQRYTQINVCYVVPGRYWPRSVVVPPGGVGRRSRMLFPFLRLYRFCYHCRFSLLNLLPSLTQLFLFGFLRLHRFSTQPPSTKTRLKSDRSVAIMVVR
jgi:hypothetical protein